MTDAATGPDREVTLLDLVIVGAGGHGRETLDVVDAINHRRPAWRFLGFVDDGPVDAARLARREAHHLGGRDRLADLDAHYVLGIGSPDTRRHLDDTIRAPAATLVHPAATLGSDVELGAGVILAAGARITTNVRIGRHSHLNANAVVSHDCRVGDYVSLSPGVLIAGEATIGDGVLLGAGAVVLPGRRVGDGAVVGAGAVVTRDVSAGVTVRGVPAR